MKLTSMSLGDFKALPRQSLGLVASEIREFLINSIANTGGHIGANLGTIELSIAMHYVFSSPEDIFIFDTGHSGYTHKILTGRMESFPTLNTYGGMSRFISRDESEHDYIEASHAGTSISVALGRAIAMRNRQQPNWTIAMIGDGALSEGVALEALNHASIEDNVRLIIVINDNGYAISPGFGAIHNYLQSREVGASLPETLFSSMGYKVIGPIDGHDIDKLLAAFDEAKRSDKVCIIHAKTEKGRGLIPAKDHPFKMHFSFPFDPKTGISSTPPPGQGYQDIAALAIEECMVENKEIVAITPSTLYATGLSKVFDRFPERCFDPGMEEQHAVSMAVGMALAGNHPVLFYQSTFLQRAFDQLIHDVCFSNQNILILTVRSGFAGYDNPTHHGVYDFSYLRCLPNIKIFYPRNAQELYEMTRQALTEISGPVLIHMPYGPTGEQNFHRAKNSIGVSVPELIFSGKDGLIIAVGNKIEECKRACEILRHSGIEVGLVNIRQLKPLPQAELLGLCDGAKRIITVEEGVLDGGFGSAISSFIHENNLHLDLLQIGLPCIFIEPGSNDELNERYELNAAGIARKIHSRWDFQQ